MESWMQAKNTSSSLIMSIISIGLIFGFITGFLKFSYYITANKYIHHKMFRLMVLDLQKTLNNYILYFLAGLFIFCFFWLFIIIKKIELSKFKVIKPVVLIILILATFFYIDWLLKQFADLTLVEGIKSFVTKLGNLLSGKTSFIKVLNKLRKHIIFIIILLASFISLISFFYWQIIRQRQYRLIIKKISKFIETRSIRKIAFFVAAFVLLLNIIIGFENNLKSTKGPNIIFICIDALRADHLGCYGYNRNTSPFMDQLAKSGVLFERIISQSSKTRTSVAAFMTSNYGTLDTVRGSGDKLALYFNTLAEILKNSRYKTAAFVANPWLKKKFGFGQGFDSYQEHAIKTRRIEEEEINDYISKNRNKKFFLYIHFMDVHNPYNPPSPFNKIFSNGKECCYRYKNGLMPDMSKDDLDYTKSLYDGEIRFLDTKIEKIFYHLEKKDILKKTLVVINSDHGDEFLEHGGMGHSTTLYNELLHIPLLIVPNGIITIKNSVIKSVVRNIDILPTILDILDKPIISRFDGMSLLPLINGIDETGALNSTFSKVKSDSTRDSLASILENKYKYIFNFTKQKSELYDLENDPNEKKDLAEAMPTISINMHNKIINFFVKNIFKRKEVKIDKETREQLRALGYIK